MDFTEKEIRTLLSRCETKATRQKEALDTTLTELKLWNDLLVKPTVKK